MKPTATTTQNENRFPVIDCHYQSVAVDGFNGHCADLSPSFREISREYFETEAHHDFLAEGALFVTMIVTATVPIVSGAFAIIELCRVFAI